MKIKTLTLEEVRALASNPPQAELSVVQLLETLASLPDEELSAWTSDALQSIESLSDEQAELVAGFCMHAAAPVAGWSCKLLSKATDDPAEYQDLISDVLSRHAETSVKQQAAAALGRVADLTKKSMQVLKQAAESDDPRLSRLASVAIDRNKAA